jgi:hypothetical protein
MRKQLFGILAAAGLFSLGILTPVHAQDTSVVTLSFPFVVEGTLLPAGTYQVNLDDLYGTVELRSESGRADAVVLTVPGATVSDEAKPALSFKKVENEYFLSEVRLPGLDAREVPLSPRTITAELAKLNTAADHATHGTQH